MPSFLTRRVCPALFLLLVALLVLGGSPQAWAIAPAAIAPSAVAPYLDGVLANVDTYWRQEQAAEGRAAPSVAHVWVAPGARVATACGVPAGDDAAFYCSTDDTIYVGQAFAGALYNGVAAGLPGQQAGFGHAAGAWALAYVVAHEYAHNVQQEDGELTGHRSALPTELNADCLAGTWARWDYGRGGLDSAGVQQALDTALAVGDFQFLSPQHHGTPQQRHDAVLTGFRDGSPSGCSSYLSL
ncbi:MAG TPA: neutral zinc metallopeptidase [Baekduia sp.]|uniref:neutral zinc metallopeptidase n=1 Tax=Baekduia sp. TaxID=2600305 RepID=UPI002BEFEE83|nr:neutral zinc metallopeptidase [Baekduia sp.]HMJ33347.1 neutral zinc metallopeptidase [Baekduia sp.]